MAYCFQSVHYVQEWQAVGWRETEKTKKFDQCFSNAEKAQLPETPPELSQLVLPDEHWKTFNHIESSHLFS